MIFLPLVDVAQPSVAKRRRPEPGPPRHATIQDVRARHRPPIDERSSDAERTMTGWRQPRASTRSHVPSSSPGSSTSLDGDGRRARRAPTMERSTSEEESSSGAAALLESGAFFVAASPTVDSAPEECGADPLPISNESVGEDIGRGVAASPRVLKYQSPRRNACRHVAIFVRYVASAAFGRQTTI